MKISTTTIIHKPVQQVWEYFDDPDNLAKWLTGFVRMEHMSGEKGQIGAKSKHYYDNKGREVVMIEEITEREEYRYFAGTLSHHSMDALMEVNFTDLGNGTTQLESINDTKFKMFALQVLSPFLKKSFQKRQDGDMAKLKELIEAQ